MIPGNSVGSRNLESTAHGGLKRGVNFNFEIVSHWKINVQIIYPFSQMFKLEFIEDQDTLII
jgi:hypothetical protein